MLNENLPMHRDGVSYKAPKIELRYEDAQVPVIAWIFAEHATWAFLDGLTSHITLGTLQEVYQLSTEKKHQGKVFSRPTDVPKVKKIQWRQKK